MEKDGVLMLSWALVNTKALFSCLSMFACVEYGGSLLSRLLTPMEAKVLLRIVWFCSFVFRSTSPPYVPSFWMPHGVRTVESSAVAYGVSMNVPKSEFTTGLRHALVLGLV